MAGTSPAMTLHFSVHPRESGDPGKADITRTLLNVRFPDVFKCRDKPRERGDLNEFR
jgi:hypothetical protein